MLTDVDRLYSELVSSSTQGRESGYRKRRIFPDSSLECFFAIEIPTKLPLLMIGIDLASSKALRRRLVSLEGITTRIAQNELGSFWLQLILNDLTRLDVFLQFLNDLLNVLSSANSSLEAASECLKRVKTWRDFMSASKRRVLSVEEQTGLYAELWTLREFVRLIGDTRSIHAWDGPNKAKKDFSFSRLSVEVKGSLQDKGTRVKVHGERQLQTFENERLFLNWLSLERSKGKSETLGQIILDLKAMHSSETSQEFISLLQLTGYREEDTHLYDDYGFQVRTHQVFEVKDGFPRITELSLPNGVASVEYHLDLSACAPFIVSYSTLQNLVRKDD